MSKDKLQRLAEDIAELAERERQRSLMPSIPFAVSDWFVEGVKAYLAGAPSLDHALGLKRGRGKPKAERPKGKNYERAKAVFLLRLPHKKPSWLEIAEMYDADVRDLQRDLKRYEPDIIRQLVADHAQDLAPDVKA